MSWINTRISNIVRPTLEDLDKDKFWYTHNTQGWYYEVGREHQYAVGEDSWWHDIAEVVDKGYDYSNKYGWFCTFAVPVEEYMKKYPWLAPAIKTEVAQLEVLV